MKIIITEEQQRNLVENISKRERLIKNIFDITVDKFKTNTLFTISDFNLPVEVIDEACEYGLNLLKEKVLNIDVELNSPEQDLVKAITSITSVRYNHPRKPYIETLSFFRGKVCLFKIKADHIFVNDSLYQSMKKKHSGNIQSILENFFVHNFGATKFKICFTRTF